MSEQIISFFFSCTQVFIQLHFSPKESILCGKWIYRKYLSFLTLFSYSLFLFYLCQLLVKRTKKICFIPLPDYFSVRKMLTFLKPLMFPPKMSPRVKGAVALLTYFQRLSLFANANHSFP